MKRKTTKQKKAEGIGFFIGILIFFVGMSSLIVWAWEEDRIFNLKMNHLIESAKQTAQCADEYAFTLSVEDAISKNLKECEDSLTRAQENLDECENQTKTQL